MTPLFKQGERTDVNNYRPISVISIIAKVFERIVYDQLCSFLASEEIITNQQSGFRSLHCTVTALLEATDSWTFDRDRGNVNAVINVMLHEINVHFKKLLSDDQVTMNHYQQ